jgi:hypothetical protein
MKRRLAMLLLMAITTPLAAQWLTLPTPDIPRTPDGEPNLSAPAPIYADGHPDLSGLWDPVEVSSDLLDASKVQEWAQTLMTQREERFFVDNPGFQCLPRGPGYLTLERMRRIVQGPSFLAMLNEDLTYRQIFMDGRALEPEPHPTWMGYSVGRWEGDTLVVESNGYNEKTWVHRRGLSHTESLRITERYHRVDFGHMQLDVTYEDSGTFDSPLHSTIVLELAADDEMLETVCNEASEGRSHWGSEITDAEATIVNVAPEILSKYVGTYQGYWLRNLITVDVTLEDGELQLRRTPTYYAVDLGGNEVSRLLAQSDNTFDCTCGLSFIFTGDEDGMATEVAEVHVSGVWAFERVP